MKALKISLAVIVAVAIGAGIFFWIQNLEDKGTVKAPENQFTRKIEQEIDQLKAKPDTEFCYDFYKEVTYHINDFYKQKRFGNNQSENDQWKENLEKNLYSAYAEKFIAQAFVIFRGSEWKSEDLKFIRSEEKTLRESNLLESGSPVAQKFKQIQIIFNKYNEITVFISSCKSFGYSGTTLSDRFPIADVKSKILRATTLRNNRLDNEFVNNCTRLHDGLKEIPQSLFRTHVSYLDSKITYWSEMYSNYNSQKEYKELLFDKLKAEVDILNDNTYNVGNLRSEYNRLINKLNADSQRAYDYFSSKNN
jgi:hypothetical protein